MKKLILIFLTIAATFNYQSVLAAIDKEAFDKEYSKARKFMTSNFDSCRYYLDRAMALTISEADTNFLEIGRIYVTEGIMYTYKPDFDKADAAFDKALPIFEKLDEKKKVANVYREKAYTSQLASNIPLSNIYYEKAISLFQEAKDTSGLALAYTDFAYNYQIMGDYTKASELYYKAVTLCEKINCPAAAWYLNNLALVYMDQGEHRKGLNLTLKALQLLSEDDLQAKTNFLSNISLFYQGLDIRDSCVYYLDLAYDYSKSQGFKEYKATCISLYADLEMKDKRYKEALELLTQQETVYKEFTPEPKRIAILNNKMAQAQIKLNNLGDAQKRLEAAEKQVNKIKFNSYLHNIYETSCSLYVAKNDYRNAFNYLQKFHVAKDSLFTLEKSKQIKELETKYNTAQKDKQIATERANTLEAECFLQEEQNAKREQRKMYLSLLGISALGMTILYLISRNRKLKNENLNQEKDFLIRESKQQERTLTALNEKNGELAGLNAIIEAQKAMLKKENIQLTESYTALLEDSKLESTIIMIKDSSKPPIEFQCEYDTILYLTSDEEKVNNRKIFYEARDQNNKPMVKFISLRMTNSDFLTQIPQRPFVQISKKNVVNLLQIKQYDGKQKTGLITMANNDILKVSPNFKDNFDNIYGTYKGNR